MLVSVPASTANLGPGFDALGMALTLRLELVVPAVPGEAIVAPDGARPADDHHPATIAFRHVGGIGEPWVRSPIPMGRGLGFSGAARVAGLAAGLAQRAVRAGGDPEVASFAAELLAEATALEGHADNVAASIAGGVVATAAGRAVSVATPLDPTVLVWVPSFTTSTDKSRSTLAANVGRDDAVFNVGRTALLVAALAAGDIAALRDATADRLHQAARFADAAPSESALHAGLAGGAWCGWLSGSGPSVALLCDDADAERVAALLPGDGHVKLLRIDRQGTLVDAAAR